MIAALALAAPALGSGPCAGVDIRALNTLVDQSARAIEAGDIQGHRTALALFGATLACLDTPVPAEPWSTLLVGEAAVRFAEGQEWAQPFALALRVFPGVDRPPHLSAAFAQLDPPAQAGPRLAPVPEGVLVYVDGRSVQWLEELVGLHAVQVGQWGDWKAAVSEGIDWAAWFRPDERDLGAQLTSALLSGDAAASEDAYRNLVAGTAARTGAQHLAGSELAAGRCDTNAERMRLLAAREAGLDEGKARLEAIEATFGEAHLTAPRGTDLTGDPDGTPCAQEVLEAAAATVAGGVRYDGMLAAGAYSLGPIPFTVVPGEVARATYSLRDDLPPEPVVRLSAAPTVALITSDQAVDGAGGWEDTGGSATAPGLVVSARGRVGGPLGFEAGLGALTNVDAVRGGGLAPEGRVSALVGPAARAGRVQIRPSLRLGAELATLRAWADHRDLPDTTVLTVVSVAPGGEVALYAPGGHAELVVEGLLARATVPHGLRVGVSGGVGLTERVSVAGALARTQRSLALELAGVEVGQRDEQELRVGVGVELAL